MFLSCQHNSAAQERAMDDDDDFTFPTVAAAPGPTTAPDRQLGRENQDTLPHPLLHHLHTPALPNLAAASPLWPFAASVSAPVTVADDEQAPHVPVSGGSGRTERGAVADEGDEEGRRVAADEDRMGLLWERTSTTAAAATATATRSSIATAPVPEPRRVVAGHAGPPPTTTKQRAAAALADVDHDDDKQRAASVADAERMDKLWESFNDDLVLRHRNRDRARRAKSASGSSNKVHQRDDPADDDRWYLCNYGSPSSGADDDGESDQNTTSASSPAERRGYGCAPTMLRASSRAGGAGQFCGATTSSPGARRRRRGRGGAAAGWALLLRLFRRLFAVDKTTTGP